MLAEYAIHPVLLAKISMRLGTSTMTSWVCRSWSSDPGEAIEFVCGAGTKLAVTKSTTGTADSQTQAGWIVPDLEAELAQLRSRGVRIEKYDLPGFKTEDGIADFGFARMAFIVDPGGNALATAHGRP